MSFAMSFAVGVIVRFLLLLGLILMVNKGHTLLDDNGLPWLVVLCASTIGFLVGTIDHIREERELKEQIALLRKLLRDTDHHRTYDHYRITRIK